MKHEIVVRRRNARRLVHGAGLVCLLAAGALLPHSAEAMGAFAAGIPDNVSTQGVAVGAGYNYSTREGAEGRAMQECQKQQDAPAETRALCKVIAYFDNECVAVSMDPQPGTPGFGWAVGADAAAANDQALQNCRQSAGADRVQYCVISLTDCDTHTPAQ